MAEPSTQSETTQQNVREEVKSLGAELRSIGDDIQAKIEQAGDEAKETWKKLQTERKRFAEKADQAAEETRADLRQVGTDLKRRFQSLRDELRSSGKGDAAR